MRRSSLLIAAIAVCAPLAVATPKIKWLSTDHNFGAFNESVGKVTAVFRFVNDGDEPLVITGARANCGCTTPKYPVEAIAPGDSAQISVDFDSGGRPGRFNKKVYIDTNTEPARSTLTVRGVVIGDEASVAQRYPVDMGDIRLARSAALLGIVTKGHIKSVYLNAYNATNDSVRPAVRDVPKWLDITMAPPAIGPGEQLSISFLVRPDKTPLYGVVSDTITVVPDPLKPEKTYRLPVVVSINEDFSKLSDKELRDAPAAILSSERINLENIPAANTTETTFSIKNDGKSPLKIRRIYSPDPGIAIATKATTIKSGKKADVMVSVTPAPDAELVNARITVITNDPITPVQTIRLTALPQ